MALIAIDPGPHTGIFGQRLGAFFSTTLNLDELSQSALVIPPHRYLWDWLNDHVQPTCDQIILEKFEFQKDKRDKENLNYDAGEYVGVVKIWCDLNKVPCHLQSPSQVVSKEGKTFWTDDKLKRVGLWKSLRTRHERDAARHYLYYVTFTLNDKTWLEKLK